MLLELQMCHNVSLEGTKVCLFDIFTESINFQVCD